MAKGGAFEHTVIRRLAEAFKPLGISEDDIFRTKNSGATKKQPGDIQFSPAMAKLWPVLVECKHYKTVPYSLGKTISGLKKTNLLQVWWKQVMREQKERKDKMGILVFRQNQCPIVVALRVDHHQALTKEMPNWMHYSWCMFTSWKSQAIVMVPFDEFLVFAIDAIKAHRRNIVKAKRIMKREEKV